MKRAIAAFAVFTAALAAFTAPAHAASQQQWNSCNSKDADMAIRACTQILSGKEAAKDRATALNKRGVAYFRKGEHDHAISDFTSAVELDPEYAVAFSHRGIAYKEQGDYDRAIADTTRALEITPNFPAALGNRASALHAKGEYDRAIADHTRAIELSPKFAAPAHSLRGVSYFSKGDTDRAFADFARAIQLDPKLAMAYNNRGFAYLKQGKLDLARADIKKALELKPDYEDAKTALAELEQAEAAKKAEAEKPKPVQQAKMEEPKPAEAKPVTPEAKTATPAVPPGKRLALVIGNANYRHTPALANPRNDAADMAAALKRLGFEVIFEQDLDKRAMDDAFRRFAREVRGADAALFYYAGHAMQFEGVNYLMPVDAKLADEADVAYEMAKLDDIVADMARMNGVRIAVLDACRNNPLEEKLKRSISLTRGVAPQRGLARVARPEGLVVAYSTQSGNVAEDGKGRNSPFTAALLGHIETPGLEVGPLFRRVMGSVKQATGGKQHPELSILFDGEFYFKPGG